VRESLRIEEYSDREFLLMVVDAYDGDGWADSEHVAKLLDLKGRKIASSRLSWLRRYGAVEREHARDDAGNLRYHRNGKAMTTQRWRLTDLGESIAYGKLRKGDETALSKMGNGQMLLVTRWLTERSNTDEHVAKLVQREWRFGAARYKQVAR
jgi:hypothetical protein